MTRLIRWTSRRHAPAALAGRCAGRLARIERRPALDIVLIFVRRTFLMRSAGPAHQRTRRPRVRPAREATRLRPIAARDRAKKPHLARRSPPRVSAWCCFSIVAVLLSFAGLTIAASYPSRSVSIALTAGLPRGSGRLTGIPMPTAASGAPAAECGGARGERFYAFAYDTEYAWRSATTSENRYPH